jgi:diadenosine tetraphosphate (Ap4A) HIT family hydrolase
MVAKQLSAAVIRSMKVEGTSIFVANGAAAGQRAPHFMMHIMPRSRNDGVNLDLPEGKLDEKTMDLVFVKLTQAVGKQLGFEPKLPAQKEVSKEGMREQKKEVKKPLPKEPAKPLIADVVDTPIAQEPPKKDAAKKANAALDDITEFLTGGKK